MWDKNLSGPLLCSVELLFDGFESGEKWSHLEITDASSNVCDKIPRLGLSLDNIISSTITRMDSSIKSSIASMKKSLKCEIDESEKIVKYYVKNK